jgi:hypothetical protein
VILAASHAAVLEHVDLSQLKRHARKVRRTGNDRR